MKKSELREKLISIIADEASAIAIEEVGCVIDEIESRAQGIRDILDDISGIDDLDYVEEARNLADELSGALY